MWFSHKKLLQRGKHEYLKTKNPHVRKIKIEEAIIVYWIWAKYHREKPIIQLFLNKIHQDMKSNNQMTPWWVTHPYYKRRNSRLIFPFTHFQHPRHGNHVNIHLPAVEGLATETGKKMISIILFLKVQVL